MSYESKKNKLLAEFKIARASGLPVALRKKTTNLFRPRNQGNVAKIDVRDFGEVIAVDAAKKLVSVEGMATYETIVAETLKHGFMPAVVPQLKTITLGGAVTGVGIESSSWRYGFPHETVTEIEVLTGNGEVITAKPTGPHQDLFYGFPNSYGSLGYALRITAKLVPVKSFVKLTHLRYNNAQKYFEDIEKICKQGTWQDMPIDFVDGMIYQKGQYYITLGQMVDTAPYTSDYTYKNIYYKSILTRSEDYLTIHDYIWRWDTDWFWCSINMGAQNKIIRRLYGRKHLRSDVFMKLFNIEKRHRVKERLDAFLRRPPVERVIQDVEIPIDNCEEFLAYYHKTINILPAWVCPVRQYESNKNWSLYRVDPKILYVNFGFWSSVPAKVSDPHWHNKSLENTVTKLKGKKSLYSDVYYDQKTFWGLYNMNNYSILKKQYDPDEVFKDLYQKTVKRG